MPTVRLPHPLREHTQGQAEVSVQGATAGAALDDLTQRFPALSKFLFDGKGKLVTSNYESINVLVNKHDIRELKGRETPLAASDRLVILRSWPAAISGGRQWNQPIGAEPAAE